MRLGLGVVIDCGCGVFGVSPGLFCGAFDLVGDACVGQFLVADGFADAAV